MSYTPPNGDDILFELSIGGAYTPPAGTTIQLEFDAGQDIQLINPQGFNASAHGMPTVVGSATIQPDGFDAAQFGGHETEFAPRLLMVPGFSTRQATLHKIAFSPADSPFECIPVHYHQIGLKDRGIEDAAPGIPAATVDNSVPRERTILAAGIAPLPIRPQPQDVEVQLWWLRVYDLRKPDPLAQAFAVPLRMLCMARENGISYRGSNWVYARPEGKPLPDFLMVVADDGEHVTEAYMGPTQESIRLSTPLLFPSDWWDDPSQEFSTVTFIRNRSTIDIDIGRPYLGGTLYWEGGIDLNGISVEQEQVTHANGAHLVSMGDMSRWGGGEFSAFGGLTIGDGKQYVSAFGNDETAFGTAELATDRYIYAAGICPPRLLRSLVVIDAFRQYVTVNGINPLTFGGTSIENFNRHLLPTGLHSAVFGAATLSNQYRTITLAGFSPLAFGVAMMGQDRSVSAVGIGSQSFGTAFLETASTKTVEPQGLLADHFGTQLVNEYNFARTITADGIIDVAFGPASVANRNRKVGPDPMATDRYGTPLVESLQSPYIYPQGNDLGGYGIGRISNYTQYLTTTGIDDGTVGADISLAYIENGILRPTGINSALYGTAFARLTILRLLPTGKSGFSAGEPFVSSSRRRLAPAGIQLDQYGTARVESTIRYLMGQGTDMAAYGEAFASFAFREILPQGFPSFLPGYPTMGREHEVVDAGAGNQTYIGLAAVADNTPRLYLAGIKQDGYGEPFVSRNPRLLFTQAINSFSTGAARAYNLRQFIAQYYEPDPLDGATGAPSIENRNRIVGVFGVNELRTGYHTIENAARPALAAGFDSMAFGSALVADSIRTLPLEGIEPGYFTTLHIVYNAARVIGPAGWNAEGFGVADVRDLTQTVRVIFPPEGVSGSPMVDFAVRSLQVQTTDNNPPTPSIPSVQLGTRYLEPAGIRLGGAGVPFVEERFTIIAPRWVLRDAYGEHLVRNLTPELGSYGWTAEEFAFPAIRTQWRQYTLDGLEALQFGRHGIADRRIFVSFGGLLTARYGTARLAKSQADPPTPQTIQQTDDNQPQGFTSFGVTAIRGNGISPEGIERRQKFGTALARMMGAIPAGIYLEAWGETLVFGPQYVTPDPIITPIIPKPSLSPHYIWAPKGFPFGEDLGELIDKSIFGEDRQQFGWPTATLYYRSIQVRSEFGLGNFATYGQAWVSNRVRTIGAEGFRTQRFGFPELPSGVAAAPFGLDSYISGSVVVELEPEPYIRPGGIAGQAFGSAVASNFIRFIPVPGLNAPQMPSPFYVGPPIPRIPQGFDAFVSGAHRVDYRVRGLTASGFDSFRAEYSSGSFANRMRVFTRRYIRPSGQSLAELGRPFVAGGSRHLHADGIRPGDFPSPVASRQNVVALGGYGFDSLEVGDVQKWEAGKIKPHGDEMSIFGQGITGRSITVSGLAGEIGVLNAAPSLGATGIDALAAGQATLTQRFACGPRAFPAFGDDHAETGTPGVANG